MTVNSLCAINAEYPMRKNVKHQQQVNENDCRAAEKLLSGERLTKSRFSKALASPMPASDGETGGM